MLAQVFNVDSSLSEGSKLSAGNAQTCLFQVSTGSLSTNAERGTLGYINVQIRCLDKSTERVNLGGANAWSMVVIFKTPAHLSAKHTVRPLSFNLSAKQQP